MFILTWKEEVKSIFTIRVVDLTVSYTQYNERDKI